MIKQIFVFLLSLITTASTIFSQCTVDAGNDVIICLDKNSNVSNGVKLNGRMLSPFKAISSRWVMDYHVIGNIYIHAKDFLDDTSVLNPKFIKGDKFSENYVFSLYVTDSLGNQCKDSVNVRISSFAILPDIQENTIKLGDTLTIYSIVGKGIPPLRKLWTPQYNISNTFIASPKVWPRKNIRYTCTTIDSAGCISDWGDYWSIIVDSTHSYIQDVDLSYNIIFNYHNPISDHSVFEFKPYSNIEKVEVYNIKGEKIHSQDKNKKLEIGKITNNKGMYFIALYINNRIQTIKILRE
jgi:hypothetical protein